MARTSGATTVPNAILVAAAAPTMCSMGYGGHGTGGYLHCRSCDRGMIGVSPSSAAHGKFVERCIVLASISLSASTYRKAVAQPGTGPGVMLWPRCPWPVRVPCTVRLYAAFSRLLFTASSFSTILHRTSTRLQNYTTEHRLCTGSFSLTHKTAEPRRLCTIGSL